MTILADFDFETYSEAGYDMVGPQNKTGISLVGATVYAEHPSTEVLSLAYNLKRGQGPQLWRPGLPPPTDLFAHIGAGDLLEAWKCMFEYLIWKNVCARMGWPPLPYEQLRDAMAKARAFGLPGRLADASKVVGGVEKQKDGTRLLNKFSVPRTPTLKNPNKRLWPQDDPEDALRLYEYNLQDIAAEAAVSEHCMDLSPEELEIWKMDQCINLRGVAVDVQGVLNCKEIIRQAKEKYLGEVASITGGELTTVTETQKTIAWLASQGVDMPTGSGKTGAPSMATDAVAAMLKQPQLPPLARRVLELRELLGASAVAKLGSIEAQTAADGRLHELFAYHAAHTGRWAGQGPQPQNLPNSGPEVRYCGPLDGCGRHYIENKSGRCPWCRLDTSFSHSVEWCHAAVVDALAIMEYGSLGLVEQFFGNPIEIVSGCLRGLFVAGPGKELICSDYSAIEAVVLAMLAGEQWVIDVFRTHGRIYEATASRITGVPIEAMLEHKIQTGHHHPHRKLGKLAALASGYGGWINAWKNFGADKFLSDAEIKTNILKWRKESPAIVAFWGGQMVNFKACPVYGLEGAFLMALQNPHVAYQVNTITYEYSPTLDIMFCRLPSGRTMKYHKPMAISSVKFDVPVFELSYMGQSAMYGWSRITTYGGRLCENVCQAVARDILANGLLNLEAAGYPVVLHVHDEAVAEVPVGWGSIEEFERCMNTMPTWAHDWPIVAKGGWRGMRFGK